MAIDKGLEEAMAKDWRLRAAIFAEGRSTPFGTLLLTLFKSKRGRPSFGPEGMIRADGQVTTLMIDENLTFHRGYEIGHVNEIIEFLGNVAEQCALTQVEMRALFDMFRSWITTDLWTAENRDAALKTAETKHKAERLN